VIESPRNAIASPFFMQISALAAPARTAASMADINFFITVYPLSFSLQYIIAEYKSVLRAPEHQAAVFPRRIRGFTNGL
jgi:hypothetical protein